MQADEWSELARQVLKPIWLQSLSLKLDRHAVESTVAKLFQPTERVRNQLGRMPGHSPAHGQVDQATWQRLPRACEPGSNPGSSLLRRNRRIAVLSAVSTILAPRLMSRPTKIV